MTPTVAGMRIARRITSVENELDTLLANASDLVLELARARIATGIEAHAIQRPMARLTRLQRTLGEARSDLVCAHSDLSKLAERMDIIVSCPDMAMLDDPHVAGDPQLAIA
ncbi:hypothetical protein [Pseudomonas sp.]|uniref:hypothetical protein n=1 Tax=Pseudomonas sp. TaxID=306 RepID=UPI003D152BEE